MRLTQGLLFKICLKLTQVHLTQGLLFQIRFKFVSNALDSMSPIIYLF